MNAEAFFMTKKVLNDDFHNLPSCACDFIKLIIKKMRYRKKVRYEVQSELAAHFEDELRDCKSDEGKEQKAQQLIIDFGDVKLLAVLLRRAKKRCRPLWRTIVARGFQAVGILILCFVVYTAWFLTGKPTVDADYLTVLNQMNRPEVVDEENAWPDYEKAIEMLVEPTKDLEKSDEFKNYVQSEYGDWGNLSEEAKVKIKKWVEENEAAWQRFVIGSSKRYCYRQYQVGDPNDKWLQQVVLPHLMPLRNLTKVGIWRTRIELEQGDTEQALQNCIAIVHVGKHWQSSVFLIEQIVGLSILAFGHYEILHIVDRKEPDVNILNQLERQLCRIYQNGYPTMNTEGERLMYLDTIQHFFTKGGFGGGHFIPKYWRVINKLGGVDYANGEIMIVPYTAFSMLHAGRSETLAKGNEIYDRLNEITKMTPYERHINDFVSSDEMLLQLSRYRHPLIHIFMPAIEPFSEVSYRGKTTHEATMTVLALQRWRLEKGNYPTNLDELISSGYLKSLPMDPYSDKPLVYKKTDNNFILYSIGRNFEDDGGQIVRYTEGKNKGKIRKWGKEGDAVFWPVLDK
jgi:hypothetical protein